MRISYDNLSGALYIKIREGTYDHTEDFSEAADVYVDVDAEGNVLGLEALSFDDLAQAVEERGGKLDVPEVLREQEPAVFRWRSVELRPELQRVREAFENLDPHLQTVLRMRFMEGFTQTEIAEKLGVSVSKVRHDLREALHKLRELLGTPQEDTDEVDDSLREALTLIA